MNDDIESSNGNVKEELSRLATTRMNRRRALSTAGKAAIGAAAVVVIGGVAYTFTQQGQPVAVSPATVTQTATKTVTGAAETKTVTAAETKPATKGTEVVAWFKAWDPYTKIHNTFVEEYEALNPDVNIDLGWTPGSPDNLQMKLKAAIAGGNAPHTWGMSDTLAPMYWEKDWLAAINPVDFGYNDLDDMLNGFTANSLDPWIRDGELYGVNYEHNVIALSYHKDMFDEAELPYPREDVPETWEWWLDTMEQLTVREGGELKRAGTGFWWESCKCGEWYWREFLYFARGYFEQSGIDDVIVGDKGYFDHKASIRALEQHSDLYFKRGISDPGFTSPSKIDDFVTKRIAVALDGPYLLPILYSIDPSLEGKIGVAPQPNIAGATRTAEGWGWGYVFDKNKSAEERANASKYIAHITGSGKGMPSTNPERVWDAAGLITTTKGFMANNDWPDWFKVWENSYPYFVTFPRTTRWEEVGGTVIRDMMDRVLLDGMDPETSAEMAQRKAIRSGIVKE